MRIFTLQLHLLMLAIALVAQAPPDPAVRTYVVTNAATFPALDGPISMLVFRNGFFQTPGVDYTLLPLLPPNLIGTRFRFKALQNRDRITVVTMPGVFMVDEPLLAYKVGGMSHIGITLPEAPPATPAKAP